jgi:hypothetical protein
LSDVEYECNFDEYKAYLETTGEWLQMQLKKPIETLKKIVESKREA